MTTIESPDTISTPAPGVRLKRVLSWAFVASLVLIMVLVLVSGAHAQSSDWQLTWSDEFNGSSGSPPDPAKWNIVTGGKGFGNNELETYTGRSANVRQQNGNLVITAQKEDFTGADGTPRHYTSARINTQNHFSQRYGRFEARIRLPSGKGIWPAFWLLGEDHEADHWPDCGEIDVLETIGARDTMYSTIHGPGYSADKGPSTKYILPGGQQVDTDFHLYAVEWSPNDIKFFFDNRLIVERTPADLPSGTKWVYDHPFYLLLNLAVGGNWPGSPDDTTVFPQRMLVDYVRVYSRKAGSRKSEKPELFSTAMKPGAAPVRSEVWASFTGQPQSKPVQ
ncbi:MAG TPA: glycoside hydrolase family 16 protein [Edaphobacter sp.]|nr:glycoside hydrolase family 16 protein [Edaphobacter sp.]